MTGNESCLKAGRSSGAHCGIYFKQSICFKCQRRPTMLCHPPQLRWLCSIEDTETKLYINSIVPINALQKDLLGPFQGSWGQKRSYFKQSKCFKCQSRPTMLCQLPQLRPLCSSKDTEAKLYAIFIISINAWFDVILKKKMVGSKLEIWARIVFLIYRKVTSSSLG